MKILATISIIFSSVVARHNRANPGNEKGYTYINVTMVTTILILSQSKLYYRLVINNFR